MFVEALHMAIALDEIGLLCTKQELLEVLRKPDQECLKEFSNKDLAVLYENTFDNDGSIISLTTQVKDQVNFITQIMTLLFFIRDPKLQEVAICQFIQTNNLYDMLLEPSDEMPVLNYEICRQTSLR